VEIKDDIAKVVDYFKKLKVEIDFNQIRNNYDKNLTHINHRFKVFTNMINKLINMDLIISDNKLDSN